MDKDSLSFMNINVDDELIKFACSPEQLVAVLLFVVILNFSGNKGIDTNLAPELLKSTGCSISLTLFSWCLDIKTSNRSHTSGPCYISFKLWCSTKNNTSFTNFPGVKVLIELTICFVDSSINNPNPICLIVKVMPLLTKKTLVCGRISNLKRALWLSFSEAVSSLAIGEIILIPQVIIGLIDHELTGTIIPLVLHFKNSLPWFDCLTVLAEKPLIWALSPLHTIAFIIFLSIPNNCIFDEKGHFRCCLVLWNMTSESDRECFPLIIKAHRFDFTSIDHLSFTEVRHIFWTYLSVCFSSLISMRQHFKISNSVDTTLPFNELIILINNHILVLEDIIVCHEWSFWNPCVSAGFSHWEYAKVHPPSERWKITRHDKCLMWLQLDVNTEGDAILGLGV